MTLTPDTSPSDVENNAATNLITNLGNRASRDFKPIKFVDKGYADYKSLFRVT